MKGQPPQPQRSEPHKRATLGRERLAQPPTTDEWTPEYVAGHFGVNWESATQIADAHNAELVTARQEGIDWADKQYYGVSGHKRIRELEQQLAAEREKVEGYRRYAMRVEGTCKTGGASELMIVSHQLGLADKENYELRKQLAAERENSNELTKQIAIGLKRENKLSQQLLAAQAAIAEHNKRQDEYVKAMDTVKDHNWLRCGKIAVDLSALDKHDEEVREKLRQQDWDELDKLENERKRLVDALNLVRKTLCSGGGLREATDIIDDALAKEGK